jgi:hypothetical protein
MFYQADTINFAVFRQALCKKKHIKVSLIIESNQNMGHDGLPLLLHYTITTITILLPLPQVVVMMIIYSCYSSKPLKGRSGTCQVLALHASIIGISFNESIPTGDHYF